MTQNILNIRTDNCFFVILKNQFDWKSIKWILCVENLSGVEVFFSADWFSSFNFLFCQIKLQIACKVKGLCEIAFFYQIYWSFFSLESTKFFDPRSILDLFFLIVICSLVQQHFSEPYTLVPSINDIQIKIPPKSNRNPLKHSRIDM